MLYHQHMTALTLTPAQRKALKAQAHSLSPVVMIGNTGLSAAVIKEAKLAIASHGLIKVRVLGDDREARIFVINWMLLLSNISASSSCSGNPNKRSMNTSYIWVAQVNKLKRLCRHLVNRLPVNAPVLQRDQIVAQARASLPSHVQPL